MKKILLFLVAVAMIGMYSCTKSVADQEIPGSIPGMGDAGGALEVDAPFILPEGIEFAYPDDVQGISASDPFDTSFDTSAELKGASSQFMQQFGCFPIDISSILALVNTTSIDKVLVIPAGTVFEVVNEEGYQSGITLTNIKLVLKANCKTSFRINLYCINEGKLGSDENVVYDIKGITSSDLIIGFIDMLSPFGNFGVEFVKEEGEWPQLKEITNKVQRALWKITNDKGLTVAQKEELTEFLLQFDFLK